MKPEYPRTAGVLLPISSLPSRFGIGTLGEAAYDFVRFLKEAGQTYWQVLPVGPTGYGDSPYQSFSAFAGNPYFIDLDRLVTHNLLTKEDLPPDIPVSQQSYVDYGALFATRFSVLRTAYARFDESDPAYQQFCTSSQYWLDDYALFMAIKQTHDQHDWQQWEEPLRLREPETMQRVSRELHTEIGFWKFCQFCFSAQWQQLKAFANSNGVQIIGDIPIYVSADSADVWSHGELFLLDEQRRPKWVAGVPPDAFSATGQRWGNPLYDWDSMEQTDFHWWRQRIAACAALFDALRIDHFIGVARYYAIPVSCPNATEGEWRTGPGEKLTNAIDEAAGATRIIAEDLGVLHPSVIRLLEQTGYAGMKILQFAEDGSTDNLHIPYQYPRNAVAYTGTHDNETTTGFCQGRSADQLWFLMDYTGVTEKSELPDAMIRCVLASVANTAIISMQDWLGLDNHARMNTPSTLGSNWTWRLLPHQITAALTWHISQLTKVYGRLARPPSSQHTV